jgi:hypothetical protein
LAEVVERPGSNGAGSLCGTRDTFVRVFETLVKVVLDGLRLPILVDRVARVEEGNCCGDAKQVGDNPIDILM